MAFGELLADTLVRFGFYDFILPFVLIFTIVFAILQKVKIFGEDGKRFNTIIGLVMGLLVVIPHSLGLYPPGRDVVEIMLQAIPNVGLVVIIILMALLIIGMMGKRFEIGGNPLSGWLALAAFVLVVAIFGAAANWWNLPYIRYLLTNPDLLALVITILVFAIVIYFVTHEKQEKDDEKTLAGQLNKMLKD